MHVNCGRLLIGSLLLCSSGCFQPWNLRLPTFGTRPPAVERAEYQYHDPFPDGQTGPSTGVRPRDYNTQRPLPVRIREKFDASRIRQPEGSFIPPPVGTDPSSQYPQVVPF